MNNNIKERLLYGKHDKEYDTKRIGAFDIETGRPGDADPLGGQFVLAALMAEGDEDVTFVDNVGAVLDTLFAHRYRGTRWFAHNGGRYDYAYLVEYIRDNPSQGISIEILPRGDGRPIAIKLQKSKQTVKLYDSVTLIPDSLDNLTKQLAPEWHKKGRTWKNEDGSTNWFNPANPTDIEYLRYDVRGLLASMRRYKDIIWQEFGVNIRLTAGSTAMAAWRATIPRGTGYWRQRKEVEDFVRLSYGGGIVHLTDTIPHHNMVHYDVNAMYAAAMRCGNAPIGSGCKVDRYVSGRPGIYHVVVTVPNNEPYPFIYFRNGAGHNQLLTGTFEAYVCSPTIEYAMSLEMGYSFEIIEGYVFEQTVPLWDTFLDSCEGLEKLHTHDGQKDAVAMAAKIMRNSLYGKYGQKSLGKEMLYAESEPDWATPVIHPETGEPLPYLYERDKEIEEPYMHVEWASWVTSQARIILNRLARAVNAVYMDTDSIVFHKVYEAAALQTVLNVGSGYGQIKKEAEYTFFQAQSPKNYCAITTDGREIGKSKAIPRKEYDFADHLATMSGNERLVQYTGINAIRQILLRGSAIATQRTRHYSSIQNALGWLLNPDGTVRVKRADEVVARGIIRGEVT